MLLLNSLKLSVLVSLYVMTCVFAKATIHQEIETIDELADFLTQVIDLGDTAKSLKSELSQQTEAAEDEEENSFLSSLLPESRRTRSNNLKKIVVNKKRFYRWPNAATRTRVKLLSQQPMLTNSNYNSNNNNNDAASSPASGSASLAEYYRRKQLEKNMIEKNRMYQYFHG